MTVTYVDVLINSVGAVTQKKFKLRITDTFYKKKECVTLLVSAV